jgi:enoyl-CoA hydratase
MIYETLLYDLEDRIATITMNRPRVLNAQNDLMHGEIADALDEAERDPRVRVVIITGAGRAFSSGHDLKDWADAEDWPHTVDTWLETFSQSQRGRVLKFWEMSKVTIAAVNGDAVGAGADLIMCSDLAVMSETARLGYPEILTSSWTIAWMVGMRHLKELMLTGEIVDAATAYRMGLVNRVVAPDRLMEEARALAQRVMRVPPSGISFNKRTMREIFEVMGIRSALKSGLNNAVLQMLTEPAEQVETRRRLIREKGLKRFLAEASSPIIGDPGT